MLGIEQTHKVGYVVVIATTCLIVLGSISVLVIAEVVPDILGFANRTSVVLVNTRSGFVPSPFFFNLLWFLSFVLTVFWIVYGLTTLCRYTQYGYLYVAPGHMDPSIYINTSLGLLGVMAWMFLVGYGYLQWSFLVILLATICIYAAFMTACHRLYRKGAVLQREDAAGEIWLARLLVHNGLDFLGTWLLYLTLVNFDIYLSNPVGLAPYLSTTIVISFASLFLLTFFLVDILACDRFCRYCVGGYIVFILGFIGTEINNADRVTSNTVYLAFALSATILATIIKITLSLYRHGRKPIWGGGRLYLPYNVYGSLGDGNTDNP